MGTNCIIDITLSNQHYRHQNKNPVKSLINCNGGKTCTVAGEAGRESRQLIALNQLKQSQSIRHRNIIIITIIS